MLPFNTSTKIENHAKAAYSAIAAFEEAIASQPADSKQVPEVEIVLGSGINEVFSTVPHEPAIKMAEPAAPQENAFFAKVTTPPVGVGFFSSLEKALSKKQAKKQAKKEKAEAQQTMAETPSATEPVTVAIETPLPFQVIGEDGKLGPVMLSMPDGEVIPAPSDYVDDCPVPVTTVSDTPEIVKVIEAVIEKVPAEEQKSNPMIAAMARANERRATQPQHSHAKAEAVRRRKVAEPK